MEENNLEKMQSIQGHLRQILMQKQAFQMELDETVSSLNEVEKSKDDIYKVVGQLMIKSPKDKILEELKNKEKIISTRLKRLDEEEERLNTKTKKLREELIKETKDSEKNKE